MFLVSPSSISQITLSNLLSWSEVHVQWDPECRWLHCLHLQSHFSWALLPWNYLPTPHRPHPGGPKDTSILIFFTSHFIKPPMKLILINDTSVTWTGHENYPMFFPFSNSLSIQSIIQDPILWICYTRMFPADPSRNMTQVATAAAAAKSLQSCPTLWDPRDSSPPGSPAPGIFQARTLEWVTISFSNAWKWKVKVKSLSHVQLLATPWTAAHQAPLPMGFSRQEYWSRMP